MQQCTGGTLHIQGADRALAIQDVAAFDFVPVVSVWGMQRMRIYYV
jgi:hypothetical protein